MAVDFQGRRPRCDRRSMPRHRCTVQASPDNGQVEITGDYRYAFHQPETLTEAKQHACAQALHLAVSNSAAVKERTATLVDSPFFHRLVHTLPRSMFPINKSCSRANRAERYTAKSKPFQTDAVEQVLLAQTVSGTDQALDQNRPEDPQRTRKTDGSLVVTYQHSNVSIGWDCLSGGLRESADVMVDFYDEQGVLVRSSRHPARKPRPAMM